MHGSIGLFEADIILQYEYLLKQYLMSNHTEKRLLKLCKEPLLKLVYCSILICTQDKSSINAAIDNLVYLSPKRQLLYVTDTGLPNPEFKTQSPLPSGRFEHLSCFFPGLLALGAETLWDDEITSQEREKWKWVAEGIAWSCAMMYRDTVSLPSLQ